ncbi:MAG: ABC transporter ATP-binding protein [Alphaproteobacteria bacterium]|nr:ABC transporter ATP-binding protein [Alphaproteobacteria bacterium]
MGNDLVFNHVVKRFGDFTAVHDLNLTIQEGEFFSFLGPSGCGKTTILRMVSGFIDPSEGSISLGGQDLVGLGPNRRPTALIFQNLALFPLMSVAENIGFALEVRGVGKAARLRKVEQLLDLIALPGFADRGIDELSGGQKQRVAIARALAVEPKVLLLDEPLSALDLKLRQHMRAELRAIQKRTGITFIYITHDQGEALAMSDRVAVMSQGHVEQVGVSSDIYNQPETAFVASFVGENNLFAGRVVAASDGVAQVETSFGRLLGGNPRGLKQGDEAFVFVRPERLRLAPSGEADENALTSTVLGEVFEGITVNISLANPKGRPIIVTMSNDGAVPSFATGALLSTYFGRDHATVLPQGSLARA